MADLRLDLPRAGGTGLTSHAITLIERPHGKLRVDRLAEQLNVSRQHLALQFRHKVGISPKLFARIRRFRATHAALQRLPGAPDWTQIALEHGYFDQSHLIYDFQDFAHSSPKTWLAAKQHQ